MTDTIFALVIQVDHDRLLLPNTAVAEVAGLENFEVASDDTQDWVVGWHTTAERRIPVLSFEILAGRHRSETGKRARIIIVNPLGQRMASGGYAILAQDQPHLTSVKAENLSALALRPDDNDELVLSRVKIEDQEALIPDLEHIEGRIASLA